MRFFCFLLILIASPSFAASPPPTPISAGTTQDKDGNIIFTFNNVPSLRMAPLSMAGAGESCNLLPESEGAMRYNKTLKAPEYCDGATWKAFGESTISYAQKTFWSPKMTGHEVDTIVQQGTFTKGNGYVAGYLMCGGGTNRLSAYLSIDGNRVVSATAQDAASGGQYEIDHSSFFSLVPEKKPWKVYIRDNIGDGVDNAAKCQITLTTFGS